MNLIEKITINIKWSTILYEIETDNNANVCSVCQMGCGCCGRLLDEGDYTYVVIVFI